jgi:hypothetical protein
MGTDPRGRAARMATILIVVGALLATASAASAKLIAATGFVPTRDGFSFENYGSGFADLAAPQMRALFGSRVCAVITKRRACVLTPPALRYMQAANRDMADGHCQGMSVLALLLFKKLYPGFGPGSTYSLRLRGDVRLQRAIAYGYMWQYLPVVRNAYFTSTPEQVLRFLIAAFRRPGGEPEGLGFYQLKDGSQIGGHEVTPIGVDELGDGRYDVLVYDNNWPGKTRRVRIDTRTDSWSYQASTNPRNREWLYQGRGKTNELVVDPTTPGLGVHPCPFCAPRRGTPAYNEIRLEGSVFNHAHLLIVDRRGRRLGYVGGRFVNQIPGARAIFPLELDVPGENQEPVYRVPAGLSVAITIDGRGLRGPDSEELSVTGPNHDLALGDIGIRPGELDYLALSASGGKFAFRSAPGQRVSPLFDVGLVGAGGDFRFQVKTLSLTPGSLVTGTLNRARRTLAFRDAGAAQSFRIALTRYAHNRIRTLRGATIRIPRGRQGIVRYGKLRPGQGTVQVVLTRF